jgi:hypothetical protein
MRRHGWQALVIVALSGLAHQALTREATPDGLSATLGIEQNVDNSVTVASGASETTYRSGHLDIDVLANVRDLAFGCGMAWAPGILGNGRLLLGGRFGWQPTVGRTRIQLLGEGGIHRFDSVGGDFFSSVSPAVVTLPYVGMQLGMTRSFAKRGHVEYGISLHVRQDLDQQTVVSSDINFLGGPTTVTTYKVGGTMLGATLAIGFRAERERASAVDE